MEEKIPERSLAGCSPWGHKESDMTERARARTHTRAHTRVCFIFGCARSSLLRGLVPSCGKRRLLSSCGASHCGGFSCCGARALGLAGFVIAAHGLYSTGSVVAEHRLSCSVACGIFLDQGSNPCLSCIWQADSLLLSHQGSPELSRRVNS